MFKKMVTLLNFHEHSTMKYILSIHSICWLCFVHFLQCLQFPSKENLSVKLVVGDDSTATKGQFLLWSFFTGDLSSCQPQRLELVFQSSLEALSQWVLGLVQKWFRICFGSFFYVFQFPFFLFL
jgi:hypothetical protein